MWQDNGLAHDWDQVHSLDQVQAEMPKAEAEAEMPKAEAEAEANNYKANYEAEPGLIIRLALMLRVRPKPKPMPSRNLKGSVFVTVTSTLPLLRKSRAPPPRALAMPLGHTVPLLL